MYQPTHLIIRCDYVAQHRSKGRPVCSNVGGNTVLDRHLSYLFKLSNILNKPPSYRLFYDHTKAGIFVKIGDFLKLRHLFHF